MIYWTTSIPAYPPLGLFDSEYFRNGMKYRHIYKEFQAIGKGGGSDSERWKDPPPRRQKVTFTLIVRVLTSWIPSVYEIKLIKSSRLTMSNVHVALDSSFDHNVTSSIIILKIEVSPRQPLWTPVSNPEKGPKSQVNDPVSRRLARALLIARCHFEWLWLT